MIGEQKSIYDTITSFVDKKCDGFFFSMGIMKSVKPSFEEQFMHQINR